MFKFDLKVVELSEKSGIDSAAISRFRGGKSVRIETLERILVALSPDARAYLLDLVKGIEADDIPIQTDTDSKEETGPDDA